MTISSISRRRTSPCRHPAPTTILKQFPAADQKVGDYLDSSILDALKADGFFAAMEQKYKQQ